MKTQKQYRKIQPASKKEELCGLVLFESEHYFLFTLRALCLSHSFLNRKNILLLEMLHFTDLQGRD